MVAIPPEPLPAADEAAAVLAVVTVELDALPVLDAGLAESVSVVAAGAASPCPVAPRAVVELDVLGPLASPVPVVGDAMGLICGVPLLAVLVPGAVLVFVTGVAPPAVPVPTALLAAVATEV